MWRQLGRARIMPAYCCRAGHDVAGRGILRDQRIYMVSIKSAPENVSPSR